MSQDFKLRFDQMRANNPAKPEADEFTKSESQETESFRQSAVRNLGLVWPDGRRAFLNYAYLVSADYDPGEECNMIRLNFTSHTVTLTGYGLDTFFEQLMDHLPRSIEMVEARYAAHASSGAFQVTGIRMEMAGME